MSETVVGLEEMPFGADGHPETEIPPLIWEGFEVGSADALRQKLEQAQAILQPRLSGPPPIFEVRTDFDKTVSPANGENGQRSTSTWEALHLALPTPLRDASADDRSIHLALQANKKLTIAAMNIWTLRELGRLEEAPDEAIAQEADKIMLRSGAAELFAFCANNDLRSLIVSAGVEEAIRYVVAKHRLAVSGIIANGLREGRWKDSEHGMEALVHTRNKLLRTEQEFPPAPDQPRCIVVLGDNPHDALMAADRPGDVVFRIRTADKHGNSLAYLEESFSKLTFPDEEDTAQEHPGFDLVLQGQGLEPVTALLKHLHGYGRQS